MTPLRQYTSPITIAQIADISQGDASDKLINLAESMVDQYIADFYEGSFSKSNSQVQFLASDTTNFTANNLTIMPNPGHSSNYFAYTVIELLEGAMKGLLIPVLSSTNNVLTFETVEGLTGAIGCQIYQLGKFPMVRDCNTFKSIPREVVEAVAHQVEYLFKNSKKINSKTKKSESIGENYSYTLEDGAADSIANRMSPLAKDLLAKYFYQGI